MSSYARVDYRHTASLNTLARASKHRAENNMFSSTTLSVCINSFTKLDVTNELLDSCFHKAAEAKVDKALSFEDVEDQTDSKKNDLFDLHSLIMVAHSLVCFQKCDDSLANKMIQLIMPHYAKLNDYALRKLQAVEAVLRLQMPDAYELLSDENVT